VDDVVLFKPLLMKGMRVTFALLGFAAILGCATERSTDYSRLLPPPAQPAAPASGDAPDAPVAPPPPSALAAADGGLGALDSGEITIQPECVLQVRVEEDPSLDGNYSVNDIGAIQFGYVGPVILFNRTEAQAAQKIREVLSKRDFKKATVRVRILRTSYDKVQVSGEVAKPQVISIGSGDQITLSDALLRAGGIRSGTRNTKAQVIRGGMLSPVPFALDKEEFTLMDEAGRPNIPHVLLRNNDILSVITAASAAAAPGEAASADGSIEVIVLGEVRRAGVYRFAPGEPATIMHLVFKMGGFPRMPIPRMCVFCAVTRAAWKMRSK
jgi:protein involved in polysaccharide export with SLBB domain